jgi:Cft2 family RNA processing exonuclease
MEAVDFRQAMTADGVRFVFHAAGHVLGAAMVSMEIAGVRVLYTGDYRWAAGEEESYD